MCRVGRIDNVLCVEIYGTARKGGVFAANAVETQGKGGGVLAANAVEETLSMQPFALPRQRLGWCPWRCIARTHRPCNGGADEAGSGWCLVASKIPSLLRSMDGLRSHPGARRRGDIAPAPPPPPARTSAANPMPGFTCTSVPSTAGAPRLLGPCAICQPQQLGITPYRRVTA